jgi:hypothetical protein
MGMDAVLCTLSAKRLAQLEAEPDLLRELLAARVDTDIPGLLDIGQTWEALDFIVSERGKEPVLRDAVLARTGREMRAAGAYGPARLLPAARVGEVAAALSALPSDVVRRRYPRLARMAVHGGYGRELASTDDVKFIRDKVRETQDREIAELETALSRVRRLYAQAATAGHALLSVIV